MVYRNHLKSLLPSGLRKLYRAQRLRRQQKQRRDERIELVFRKCIPEMLPEIQAKAGSQVARTIGELAMSMDPTAKDRSLVSVSWPGIFHPIFLRRNTTDVAIFVQIFVEQQYAPLLTVAGSDQPGVFLDCGANAGFASAWFLSKFPSCEVVAIEPQRENAEICCQNLSAYGHRATVHQNAIWHEPGVLIHMQDDKELSWGYQFGVEQKSRRSEAVQTLSLDQIIKQCGQQTIHAIKIDIEGAEKQVFSANTSSWLKRCRHLAIELHGPQEEQLMLKALRPFQYSRRDIGEVTFINNLRWDGARTRGVDSVAQHAVSNMSV